MTKKRNMDNETAKAFLIQAFNQYLYNTNEQCKEAFAIAIKALEREETCENKDCGTEMIFECSVCGASTIDRMEWQNGEFNYCPNCGRKVEETK